jgi:hypothetical protein
MLKKFIYSLEGKVSTTKIGILIMTLSSALIAADYPANIVIGLKILFIIGAALAGNGFRDAISKLSTNLKELVDKMYNEAAKK